MAGATGLNRKKDISKFQPAFATDQAYIGLASAGVNVVTATVVTNTGGVTAVAHSLGVPPASYAWTAIAGAAGPALPVTVVEHSAANNSVVGVRAYTLTASGATDYQVRFTFFPPAT